MTLIDPFEPYDEAYWNSLLETVDTYADSISEDDYLFLNEKDRIEDV